MPQTAWIINDLESYVVRSDEEGERILGVVGNNLMSTYKYKL